MNLFCEALFNPIEIEAIKKTQVRDYTSWQMGVALLSRAKFTVKLAYHIQQRDLTLASSSQGVSETPW